MGNEFINIQLVNDNDNDNDEIVESGLGLLDSFSRWTNWRHLLSGQRSESLRY